MSSPQARSKQWGYEVERQALAALQVAFPDVERTGSSNQVVKGAADLATPKRSRYQLDRDALLLVVTKDKGPGNPLLVTLAMSDFIDMTWMGSSRDLPLIVQVKGRARTWIGALYRELRDAVQ